MKKNFIFTVYLTGQGETEGEAWADAYRKALPMYTISCRQSPTPDQGETVHPFTTEENPRAKVFDILQDIQSLALAKLASLQRSGVDIVGDHEANGCNYVTPKAFIVAFADEIKRQYAPLQRKGLAANIRNYFRMM